MSALSASISKWKVAGCPYLTRRKTMELLNGNEKFTLDGNDTGISVSEFWSWAYSDLLNNTLRGVLAEFLVKKSFSFLPPPEKF